MLRPRQPGSVLTPTTNFTPLPTPTPSNLTRSSLNNVGPGQLARTRRRLAGGETRHGTALPSGRVSRIRFCPLLPQPTRAPRNPTLARLLLKSLPILKSPVSQLAAVLSRQSFQRLTFVPIKSCPTTTRALSVKRSQSSSAVIAPIPHSFSLIHNNLVCKMKRTTQFRKVFVSFLCRQNPRRQRSNSVLNQIKKPCFPSTFPGSLHGQQRSHS